MLALPDLDDRVVSRSRASMIHRFKIVCERQQFRAGDNAARIFVPNGVIQVSRSGLATGRDLRIRPAYWNELRWARTVIPQLGLIRLLFNSERRMPHRPFFAESGLWVSS